MKLITWGKGREEAIARMKRALAELRIQGIKTTIPLHRAVLEDDEFLSGMYSTDFLNKPELKNKIIEKANMR
jgi:acetyl-CoA carboxylase biotin carboxylase subunit